MKNELDTHIELQQIRDDEFQARIVLLEEFQKSINETVAQQQDRIRQLSEIQNEIKTQFEDDSEEQAATQEEPTRTKSAIQSVSSSTRTLPHHTR